MLSQSVFAPCFSTWSASWFVRVVPFDGASRCCGLSHGVAAQVLTSRKSVNGLWLRIDGSPRAPDVNVGANTNTVELGYDSIQRQTRYGDSTTMLAQQLVSQTYLAAFR